MGQDNVSITFWMPKWLVDAVDIEAERRCLTRSSVIRQAVINELQRSGFNIVPDVVISAPEEALKNERPDD